MLSPGSSYQRINRNQLNRSSSKQIFAFSRQPRFRNKTQSLTSRSDYVNFPGIAQSITKRGITFSKSRKALIFENQLEERTHPPPNIYETQRLYDRKIGFSLGKKLKDALGTTNKLTPGPATYDKKWVNSRSSVSFSKEKRKLKYPLSNQKGQDTPGPYLIEINRMQKILSKYKSTREIKIKAMTRIQNPEEIRQKIQKLKTQIVQKKNKNNSRAYNLRESQNTSLIKSRGSIVFNKAPKKSCFDVNTKEKRPGPANYDHFTQFAHLNKPVLEHSTSNIRIRPKARLQNKPIGKPPISQSKTLQI